MKTTVATMIRHDEQNNTQTWRYALCDTVSDARKVAKRWAKENPEYIIQIAKGHTDVTQKDCFFYFNPFEIWENGKPAKCLGTCVWKEGEAMKHLPHPRRC